MTYPVPTQGHSEAPLSINFKIPEIPGSPMLTIRANQGIELDALSADVAQHAAGIGRALTEVRAGMLAGANVHDASQAPSAPAQQQTAAYQPQGQQYAAPAAAQAPYQAPPQTGGAGSAPTCPHGVREFRSGVSQKTGRPYKMWVCSEPQGPSQCKPEFVK